MLIKMRDIRVGKDLALYFLLFFIIFIIKLS